MAEIFLDGFSSSESSLDDDVDAALRFKLPLPLTGVTDGLVADEPEWEKVRRENVNKWD